MGIGKGTVETGDYQNLCRPEVNFLVLLDYTKGSQDPKVREGTSKFNHT